MVINKETLDLKEPDRECDAQHCPNLIEGKGRKVGELTFCNECADRAEAMSWRPLSQLGYEGLTNLATYYA